MTLRPWEKLSESILLKSPWWTYKRDTFHLLERLARHGVWNLHGEGESLAKPDL
jgi:hypothetical protein